MPTTYRILINIPSPADSPVNISSALFSIGRMPEEIQEASRKYLKQFREHNTRKISREVTNLDVINRLYSTADSSTTSLRQKYWRKDQKKVLPVKVIELLRF